MGEIVTRTLDSYPGEIRNSWFFKMQWTKLFTPKLNQFNGNAKEFIEKVSHENRTCQNLWSLATIWTWE